MAIIKFVPLALGSSPGAEVFFRWKEAMKTLGWTVEGSGDGTTNFSLVGDIITGFANAPNGVNNRAWIRLRDPGGVAEIVQQAMSGTAPAPSNQGISSRTKYSPLARFTGGAAGFSVVPSATDEFLVRGVGTDASPMGWSSYGNNNPASLVPRNPHFLGLGETTFPFRFWFSKHIYVDPAAAGFAHAQIDGWIYDLCQGEQDPTLDDPNQMFIATAANLGGVSGIALGTADVGLTSAGWLNQGPVANSLGSARMAASGPLQYNSAGGPGNQSNGVAVSPWLAGAHDLVNAVVYRKDADGGITGIKGVLSWVRGVMQTNFQNVNTFGTTYTLDGAEHAYLQMGQIALPWGDTAPDATWSNQVDAILWNHVTDQAFAGAGGVNVFRMRADDAGLGRLVYWSAPRVDLAGDFYTGPGALSSVVVSNIFTQSMI